MSVNLYFVRSGETSLDEQGIVQGRLDEFLSPWGLMQAHVLADKLDREDFERAWSSGQNRAVQVCEPPSARGGNTPDSRVETADVILYSHPTVDLCLDRRLNDRARGSDEGHRWETKQDETPDAEPWSSVHARVRQFLLDALAALSPGPKAANILVVTHLPCLMVLDQVLPEVGIDLDMGERSHDLDIQPEQVGVVRLLKQGTRWSGEVENQ